MRNISFALTTDQIRAGTKTVTRRMGWLHLKPGDLLSPVVKGMGLKPGEKIERIRPPIRVKQVTRELLSHMHLPCNELECYLEGFPEMTPAQFIEMFCKSHKGCTPNTMVTRIEFEYTTDNSGASK